MVRINAIQLPSTSPLGEMNVGARGLQGPRGFTGSMGPEGEEGRQGPRGIDGERGKRGEPGKFMYFCRSPLRYPIYG